MTKPIELEELALRIGALLRRAKAAANRQLTIGNLTLRMDEHTAYLDGKEIPMTYREFCVLYKLLSSPRRAFTRTQLTEEFWNADSPDGSRTVDVYITKLRSKLAGCPAVEIQTVRGLGYKAVIK